MNSYLLGNRHLDLFLRWGNTTALACCWICGLLLGISYGQSADESYYLLMRMATLNRVSIVGLLTAHYLPFLIAALVAFLMRPQLMLIICFYKAFSFACCGYAAAVIYGSAGWLVRLLLQFSDFCTVPFLYWFCMRNISGNGPNIKQDFMICSFASLVAGILDFCVISPFLAKLIDI